ncbi:thiol-disulfide oxidoreductase DCC family protein [Calothrix sp. PCC 6303]|uniref:thiol-disulfide oxidoreductase DCC family protein n=1 Tax=Calothrix sp. PCC 6303 TaxID=1170562 RepID=UPI0002A037DA|nr:DCC1-like thiol-disulfide oxidoreductase family protein [Calothrix sp. PCC 6303]AFZ02128.1 thiol-disulfide oxidoreductase DCC [Calothrix sp. PCC 6303]
MNYFVIYDGYCNLCVTLVKLLENLDQGKKFSYAPMQDEEKLSQLAITSKDCELGMILVNLQQPEQRWQGSDAAEEIGRLLPMGEIFVKAYQGLPGLKSIGDQFYGQIRDHRYQLFGRRDTTYLSRYCSGDCQVINNK